MTNFYKALIPAIVCAITISGYFVYRNLHKSNLESQREVEHSELVGEYLTSLINYAHEGYLADATVKGLNSNDLTGEMAGMIEEIGHETAAVSSLTKYASSTNSKIASSAQLLIVSEADVAAKHQKSLAVLRQLTNGTIPTDVRYSLAEMQAAQSKRNDDLILVAQLLPALTLNLNPIDASSTAKVGALDPAGALTSDEKISIRNAIQMSFGESINSNENDIFLLLAQEINLLVTSDTYSDFYDAWTAKVKNAS